MTAFADQEVRPRRARITLASEIEPEPVKWGWTEAGGAGRIPAGSLFLAAGREGTGKSSFGIWLAAQLTRGTLPGGHHQTPGNVLYAAVEDSWKHTLVPRLHAAKADLSRVGRFEVVNANDEELTLSLPHDNTLFEEAIEDFGAVLVVIDPLISVIGEKVDTHRERDVRTALDPLARIADRTGCMIGGIAHFSKGQGSDAASLITGSGAFKNVPRSVFGFARDDDNDCRVLTQVKNSLGRDDLPSLKYNIETANFPTPKGWVETGKFVFLGESERSVGDILRESNRRDDDPQGDDGHTPAQRFILRYIETHGDQDGEVRSRDAIKAAGELFNESELTKARLRCKRPKILTRKAGKADGWLWRAETQDSTQDSQDSKTPTLESSESSTESSTQAHGDPDDLELDYACEYFENNGTFCACGYSEKGHPHDRCRTFEVELDDCTTCGYSRHHHRSAA